MGNWLQQIAEWIKGLRCWYIVRPWEQGINVRCGRWVFNATPGFHIRLPFLDEVFIQNVRLRVVNLPVQTVTNKEGLTTTVSAVVSWRIADVRKLYEKLHTPEDWIYNTALSAVAEVMFSTTGETDPKSIGDAAAKALADGRALGIVIESVAITDFARVRTYRLISGEGNTGWSWNRVGALEGQPK